MNTTQRTRASKYSTRDRMEALKILEANNHNYYKTQQQTGIDRSTLRKWSEKLGVEVFGQSKFTDLCELVEQDYMIKKRGLIDEYFDVYRILLKRMAILIPKETDLKKLAFCLKELGNIFAQFDENQEKSGPGNELNILDYINKQITAKENQPEYNCASTLQS